LRKSLPSVSSLVAWLVGWLIDRLIGYFGLVYLWGQSQFFIHTCGTRQLADRSLRWHTKEISVDLRTCQVAVNKRKFLVLLGVKRRLLRVHCTRMVMTSYFENMILVQPV